MGLRATPQAIMVHAWRHPATAAAAGRCIGRTDLPVDPRRARRLAGRIARFSARNDLPRIVLTSPLARSRDVGRCLARRGWEHQVLAELTEVDFGRWDGMPWDTVPRGAMDAWLVDFGTHRFGGGESVSRLLERVRAFDPGPARVIVAHGGWLSAWAWLSSAGAGAPDAAKWPPPPRHGERVALTLAIDARGRS